MGAAWPAAAYVRMSTDHQKYSIENQLDTIRRYAEQRGFEIIRVFEDSGRSGLRIDDRDGLQLLMREVQSGSAGFRAILVYEVSRWEGSRMRTRRPIRSISQRTVPVTPCRGSGQVGQNTAAWPHPKGQSTATEDRAGCRRRMALRRAR